MQILFSAAPAFLLCDDDGDAGTTGDRGAEQPADDDIWAQDFIYNLGHQWAASDRLACELFAFARGFSSVIRLEESFMVNPDEMVSLRAVEDLQACIDNDEPAELQLERFMSEKDSKVPPEPGVTTVWRKMAEFCA